MPQPLCASSSDMLAGRSHGHALNQRAGMNERDRRHLSRTAYPNVVGIRMVGRS